MTAISGGHRVSTMSVVLFRVGTGRRLVQLFAGEIERRDGDQVETGGIALFAGGLRYRAPGTTAPIIWTFDHLAQRYEPTP